MESRFTFKDFIFVVLFLGVIGAVVWVGYQFSYQESRLNDVKGTLAQMGTAQKEEAATLARIERRLAEGVVMRGGGANGATTQGAEADGRIRRKNADGSLYVYYPTAPVPPRDPHVAKDYAAGDWLVQNLGSEPEILTPLNSSDASAMEVQTPVLESLLTQNPETFEWEPFLAESYEVSADGLKVVFKLRKNICFSDGSPITPDDVVFTYNTIMNPGIQCAPLRSFYEHLKGVKKLDGRTVEFDFDQPYFLSLDVAGGMQILPKHIYKFKTPDEYNNRSTLLVGSGPYKVERWDKGSQIVLVRNDKYWGERPTFDRVVMKFIQNPQAALQEFQGGQLDYLGVDPDQWVKFTKDPEFMKKTTTYSYLRPNAGYTYIGYNELRPMFKDKETRRALTMLLDRPAMIHTFMKDLAEPITGPFNPLSPQDDLSIKPWPYDVAGAKALLAKAGWKPGSDGILERDGKKFEFSLVYGNGYPLYDRIANYIKEQFAGAGIRVQLTPYEFSVLIKRLDDRDFDASLIAWTGSLEEDPYQIWDSASIADKGSNYISFRNKESDELIEQGRRTLDKEKRMGIWHKWQALIHEEQPYTFLYIRKACVFIQPRFKNTEPYKVGISPYDWYVPAGEQKYR